MHDRNNNECSRESNDRALEQDSDLMLVSFQCCLFVRP